MNIEMSKKTCYIEHRVYYKQVKSMRTIATIYHPITYKEVKELTQALKQKEILERYHLQPCNLWLPFDFHLYEDALLLCPDQEELSKDEIRTIAERDFSWLAAYFEVNGMEHVINMIANQGFIYEQLKQKYPMYSSAQIYLIMKEEFEWIIKEEEQKQVFTFYQQIIKKWEQYMKEDLEKKLNLASDFLIISFDTEKAMIDLNAMIFSKKNVYFIEPISQVKKSGWERYEELRQYQIQHHIELLSHQEKQKTLKK